MFITFFLAAIVALANASTGYGPGDQEWGHVTVRMGAHMFWWLHKNTASVSPADRPLVIWLQGGPGHSSTGHGNFLEVGPRDIDLNTRSESWVNHANVLFVDAPVGAGFSYKSRNGEYSDTDNEVGKDLVKVYKQVILTVPALAAVPVYIVGEGYGAKFALQFAKELNASTTVSADLQGLLLSNPWVCPIDSVKAWGAYLQYFAVVDPKGRDDIDALADATKFMVDHSLWAPATALFQATQRVALHSSDYVNFYNILKKVTRAEVTAAQFNFNPILPIVSDVDEAKLQVIMANVKTALGLPSSINWGAKKDKVFLNLYKAFMKCSTNIVEDILDNASYKVFVMNGQLDAMCSTPGTLSWVDRLNWSGKADYADSTTTPRTLINIDNVNVGYEKVHEKFGMFWINRAGHLLPSYNQVGAEYVLKKLTNNYAV